MSSKLTFSIEESLWLNRGQEISEVLAMSLEPNISIQEMAEHVVIKGGLMLHGEYRPIEQDESEGAELLHNSLQEGLPNVRLAKEVTVSPDGLGEVKHFIPIDVTIPVNRIKNLDDIYVHIESFDYDLPERSCIQLTADITISGMSEMEIEPASANEPNYQYPSFEHQPFHFEARRPFALEHDGGGFSLEDDELDEPPFLANEQEEAEVEESEERMLRDEEESEQEVVLEREEADEPEQEAISEGEEGNEPEQEAISECEEVDESEQEVVSERKIVEETEQETISECEEVEEPAQKVVSELEIVDEPKQEAISEREIVEEPAQEVISEREGEVQVQFKQQNGEQADNINILMNLASNEEGEELAILEVEAELSKDDESEEATYTSRTEENALYLTKMLQNGEEKFTRLKMCIIQENESLDTIAERYNLSTSQLIRANRLEEETVSEGQILYIPVTASR